MNSLSQASPAKREHAPVQTVKTRRDDFGILLARLMIKFAFSQSLKTFQQVHS